MTRLTSKDIASIAGNLSNYDAELAEITGCSLKTLACLTAGFDETLVKESAPRTPIAVIPITAGFGVIKGFCEAVAAIAAHIGCPTFITAKTDVAGMAEAVERQARVIMLADDQFFVVIHHQSHWFMDNALATAKGFVTGLKLMAGDRPDHQNVLVIGCGRVGQQAVKTLLNSGYDITIYDINSDFYNSLFKVLDNNYSPQIHLEKNLENALKTHRLILDASPAKDIIHAAHIKSDTYISAPGVPLGLDRSAIQKIGRRLLHDPLQIGVAAMTVSAIQACHEH